MAATIDENKLLIAVGYKNGSIELYNETSKNDFQMTQRLECHRESVNFLIFSPLASETMENDLEKESCQSEKPIILASVAEEICFWNVTHALNNPMERRKQLRLSQRINRRSNSIQVNANVNVNDGNTSQPNKTVHLGACSPKKFNPWMGKIGTLEKPELLACTKLVGSSAEKIFANQAFNTFITVDNEGVMYFLRAERHLNEM